MFSRLEFFIALRYLKSKQKEGFISVIAIFSFIGIMIGVATLIIVMSVMNGFRYDLVNRILGINSHISINSYSGKIENYEEIINKLQKESVAKYLNPIIEDKAMVISNNANSGALIKALKFKDLENKKLITNNILSGDISAILKKDKILIGSALANSLGAVIDDEIKIASATTNQSILGTIPRIKTYKIGGIFESGLYEYDSSTIFMNYEMAEIHFRKDNAATAIEIFGEDPSNISHLKSQINQIIAKNYLNLYLVDWKDQNSGFIEALKVERTVMFLILTLIILVAAFNIISSLIMLVGDKKKNIACLRVMGMSKSSIMKIFLICGSLIGFVGTLFGLLIGILFSANINNIKLWLESITDATLFNPTIYFLSQLPSKIFISDVVLITLMALILSFLATIYPALKASKANPAEILRYE